MSTVDSTKKPLPRSFIPLLILTLVAVGLAIYRLVVGLGPTTNLTDHNPWGLWISIDMFLIPVAGAGFTISLITYFFGRERYHTVIRAAVLAGLFGYIVVGVLALLDIGRWFQVYNIFVPRYINLHSFLQEVNLDLSLQAAGVADEIEGFNFERAKLRATKIFDTTAQILQLADAEGVPPAVAADRLAERRMAEVGRLRSILVT